MTQTDDMQKVRRSKSPESSPIAASSRSLNDPGGCEMLFFSGTFLPSSVLCARPRLRIRELRRGKNADIIRLTFPKRRANVSDRLARAIREILWSPRKKVTQATFTAARSHEIIFLRVISYRRSGWKRCNKLTLYYLYLGKKRNTVKVEMD